MVAGTTWGLTAIVVATVASLSGGFATASACAAPGSGPFVPHDNTFTATVVSTVDRTAEVPTPEPPLRWMSGFYELHLTVDRVYSGAVYAAELAMSSGYVAPGSRVLVFATRDDHGALYIDGCTGRANVSAASSFDVPGHPPQAGADPVAPDFSSVAIDPAASGGGPSRTTSLAIGAGVVLVLTALVAAAYRRVRRPRPSPFSSGADVVRR